MIARPEKADRLTLRWSGGAYEDREGMWLRAFPDGIWIDPWYDGGIGILRDEDSVDDAGGFVTWEQLEGLKAAAVAAQKEAERVS